MNEDVSFSDVIKWEVEAPKLGNVKEHYLTGSGSNGKQLRSKSGYPGSLRSHIVDLVHMSRFGKGTWNRKASSPSVLEGPMMGLTSHELVLPSDLLKPHL